MRVELSAVDGPCEPLDDLRAPGRPVAAWAVGMRRVQPGQDPGPVQEIVDQGVDRDHGGADFGPPVPIRAAAEKQVR